MSGPARLAARLPDGDGNGLAAIAHQLVDEPTDIRVVIALIDTMKISANVDDGSHTATVRIRRIEVITDHTDQAQLRRLLMREFERRTGQTTLPLDLENDIHDAFNDTDDKEPPA